MSEKSPLPDDQELTTSQRIKLLSVAAGIAAVLATYVYARDTGEHSPIEVPQGSSALPWPNANTQPFLVPESAADQANCGQFHTFLGSLYDSTQQTSKTTESIRSYEQTYQAAQGEHTTLDIAEMRLALASLPNGKVVSCPPAPSVHYFEQ